MNTFNILFGIAFAFLIGLFVGCGGFSYMQLRKQNKPEILSDEMDFTTKHMFCPKCKKETDFSFEVENGEDYTVTIDTCTVCGTPFECLDPVAVNECDYVMKRDLDTPLKLNLGYPKGR